MAGLMKFVILAAFVQVYYVNAYVVDDSNGVERKFDGIGGLSGGGATSKLLVNYPEQQRDEILDYLFKPNFGASLQILKVEIGGDSQSTDGSESSHMHEPWDENYERGYEWWLMTEAKKRNPDIILYGLPWAWPGWIGKGSSNPYVDPEMTASYIIKWLLGAKRVYGLTIDYVGIWNERNYDITYIKTLRKALDQNGFEAMRIVAPDGAFSIANDMIKDNELKEAIYAVGAHYPGTISSPAAQSLGTQLWSSEDYSTKNDEVGGGCWARLLNQNYVNGYMTSTISWNLIASYYLDLPYARCGLMTAVEPWSGNYAVETPIWVSAHTTQFTEVGWSYLKHGAGVGHLDKGGSYVTLVSPDKTQLTMIIETMSHDHSVCIRPALPKYNVTQQTATFTLKGSFSSVTELNVWTSQIGFNGKKSNMMVNTGKITVTNGMFSINLGVDEIYTLTTTTGGKKGGFGAIPASAPFPMPYKDDFDSYPEFSEAFNFPPQVGVFEIRRSSDPTRGMVNRQVVIQRPVDWCKWNGINSVPKTIGGNYQWTDIYVQSDVMVPSVNGSDGVFLGARLSTGGCAADTTKGVFFHLNVTAKGFVISTDSAGKNRIKVGTFDAKLDTWYTLTLMVKGSEAMGYINMKQVTSATVPAYPANGFVGYGTNRFGYADFDNFMVEDSTFIPTYGHGRL